MNKRDVDRRASPGDESTLPVSASRSPKSGDDRHGYLTLVHSPDEATRGCTRSLPADDVFLVGRGVQHSGWAVIDVGLSRLHFRVTWDGRQRAFRLGDAGSKNGTFVNGQPTVAAALRRGDVIRAGDSLFVFHTAPATSSAERLTRAARSSLPVLLTGETGSGKEVTAKKLHEESGRTGRFVAVNCATIPRDLVAAELFGHTRGAFSGALRAREGLFPAADRGTLLLDEVADLPIEVQPALLRALQESAVRPVGSETERHVDARIVAATHVDLEAACATGRFRNDLYARLAQLVIQVPPLRERRHELIELVHQLAPRPLRLTTGAAEAMLLWTWPRNVRELKRLIDAFAALTEDEIFDTNHMAELEPAMIQVPEEPLPTTTASVPCEPGITRSELLILLERHGGNVSAIATEIGRQRPFVYRWMKSYGLSTRTWRTRS